MTIVKDQLYEVVYSMAVTHCSGYGDSHFNTLKLDRNIVRFCLRNATWWESHVIKQSIHTCLFACFYMLHIWYCKSVLHQSMNIVLINKCSQIIFSNINCAQYKFINTFHVPIKCTFVIFIFQLRFIILCKFSLYRYFAWMYV